MTTLTFPSVRQQDLAWIWERSPAFNAFRGTGWMGEPCRTCPRRELDFGGCRCQAFALTGDAGRTDPVCVYSPDHHLVEAAVDEASHGPAGPWEPKARGELIYRRLSRAVSVP
jgi:pyrroloquinoline quinone biosynthesis protein E